MGSSTHAEGESSAVPLKIRARDYPAARTMKEIMDKPMTPLLICVSKGGRVKG
jgi:hypothetical protein